MARKKPMTAAVRVLRRHGIAFTEHQFKYVEGGETGQGARELGVPEHAIIKTLIMEDDHKNPLVVLMHGDCQVSTKQLARHLEVRSITPCEPKVASKHSGYLIGGTSPFGTRRVMPVLIEASILELPKIYINGGRRGYLLAMDPQDLQRVLQSTPVRVAQ